jgi:hypothetical protein
MTARRLWWVLVQVVVLVLFVVVYAVLVTRGHILPGLG